MGPEAEEDLIAFAERQERSGQAALTPRQVLLGAAVLGGVALLVAGIALLTSTGNDQVQNAEPPHGKCDSARDVTRRA